jgi:hypothetical protein
MKTQKLKNLGKIAINKMLYCYYQFAGKIGGKKSKIDYDRKSCF